ncbi:uncharacterized protein LOC105167531 isoform X4 [Sesamum indicum]|uniref:Uncharacterized protein LOC105167531 isoform X3 n=1 Tax=Sesamum indicum TaxID=4182 RepID=A0A8M8V7G0_SESIN|nr:uncharacterized protein LOC105167531 isoform X3 [Sesamum indicum]XP_020552031.1 uncharacterized protein LOC105167531 isoform X4 [Sesamum indicum]
MGKRKSPDKAAGREKEWDRVFNALVTLSQNLQKDRRFLEERRKSLHQVIYKMKKEQKVESAKAELMLGLKDREAFTYKQRYGKARILSLVEGVKHQKKNQILCRPLRRWLIESEVLVSQLKERPLGSNSIERKRSARKSSEGKAPRQQFNLQMAHRKRSARKSSEGKARRLQFNLKAAGREKEWDRVFNALVTLSQNLQKDRRFLEERRKSLHQVIYKMKKEQKVESAKAELMLGLKDREAFTYKQRYGKARILSHVEGVKHRKKNQILCRPLRRWLIESEVLVSQLKERPLGSNSIERWLIESEVLVSQVKERPLGSNSIERWLIESEVLVSQVKERPLGSNSIERKRSARKSSEGKAPRQQFNLKMAHGKRSARKSSEWKARRLQFNLKRFVEQLCELSRSSAAFLSQNATLKADRTMEGANMDRSIEVISRIGDKLKSTESHDIVS